MSDATAESGPPLLHLASVNNAKTWKFEPHTAGNFHITYHFEIASSDVAFSSFFPNASGKFEVKVVVLPPPVIIDYAWIGLGKWNAKLRSQHGSFSKTFEFAYSGPDAYWLVVNPRDSAAEDEDSDASQPGSRDGDFLIFSIKLAEPDGKRLKTYLIGKMARDKIVGTFVDESGVRGKWTAARIPDSPKK